MSSDGTPRVVERSTHAGPDDYRRERKRERATEVCDAGVRCRVCDAECVCGGRVEDTWWMHTQERHAARMEKRTEKREKNNY